MGNCGLGRGNEARTSDPRKMGGGDRGANAGAGQQDSPHLTGFCQLGMRKWEDAKDMLSFGTMCKGCW